MTIVSNGERQVYEELSKVATTDTAVLLCGLSNVEKEQWARHVHERSARSKAAFVSVHCSGLSADSFDDELFGHGAFASVLRDRVELVTAADGGTLFFDALDLLTSICQLKFLRFLQEKEYRRLGETRIRRANVRIIAATNTDLFAAVREGRFREDLFNCLTCVHLNHRTEPVERQEVNPTADGDGEQSSTPPSDPKVNGTLPPTPPLKNPGEPHSRLIWSHSQFREDLLNRQPGVLQDQPTEPCMSQPPVTSTEVDITESPSALTIGEHANPPTKTFEDKTTTLTTTSCEVEFVEPCIVVHEIDTSHPPLGNTAGPQTRPLGQRVSFLLLGGLVSALITQIIFLSLIALIPLARWPNLPVGDGFSWIMSIVGALLLTCLWVAFYRTAIRAFPAWG